VKVKGSHRPLSCCNITTAAVYRLEEDGNLPRSDRGETGFDSQGPDWVLNGTKCCGRQGHALPENPQYARLVGWLAERPGVKWVQGISRPSLHLRSSTSGNSHRVGS